MDDWDKLRHGHAEQCVESLRIAFLEDATNPSLAIRLGAIYLWLRDWEAAYDHFQLFAERYPWSADFVFCFLGTAKWCAGERRGAISEWQKGVDCDYSDMAGGITIPLHLYFASVTQPALADIDDAVKLLETRIRSPRGHRWPGIIASLVLGHIDKPMALADAAKDDPNGTALHEWHLDFWSGVRQLARGDRSSFLSAMKKTGEVSWDEFDMDRDTFISKARSTVLHLARYEGAART